MIISERLRLPVIGAPLFVISNPDLVIAQCKAGIVGSFPALNARPAALLDEWLHRIQEELSAWDREHSDTPSAPFAVNQIVHRSNQRLEEDLTLCVKRRVPIVITSLGAREDLNHVPCTVMAESRFTMSSTTALRGRQLRKAQMD
jgi:nitronate monooxygenase